MQKKNSKSSSKNKRDRDLKWPLMLKEFWTIL